MPLLSLSQFRLLRATTTLRFIYLSQPFLLNSHSLNQAAPWGKIYSISETKTRKDKTGSHLKLAPLRLVFKLIHLVNPHAL